jgi:hypothetical protein
MRPREALLGEVIELPWDVSEAFDESLWKHPHWIL